MRIKETSLNGVFLITPHIIKDLRGYFFESFKRKFFSKSSIPIEFAQENHSFSYKGTFRRLHYQFNIPLGKLISVAGGRVVDFVVDIRKGSPTFGKSESFILDDIMHESLYISEGFAHGFYVESDQAVFKYKCTESYHPEDEYGVLWNDSDISINWPSGEKIVSDRDNKWSSLQKIDPKKLPDYK